MLLPVAVASGFVLALFVPVLRRLLGRYAAAAFVALPAALAVLFGALAADVIDGTPLRFETDWVPQLDLALSFSLDGLSLLFCLLITGVGAAVILYAEKYLAGHDERDRFHALALAFMASMLGLVLADDLLLLVVFWGLTGITSFLLIGFEHAIGTSRLSAQQALIVTFSGELAMIAGLVLLGFLAETFTMSELPALAETIRAAPTYGLIVVLILLGALAKSAQFPFHFWLPNAMAAPTPVSAYLHSATMVTAGVYLVSRLTTTLGGTELWTVILVVSGGLTMLIGAFLSLRMRDLKLVLAYSTVGALGTMVLLLGLGGSAAAIAAMALLVAHALYKAGLFLVTGIIDHETGTRELDRLGGLARVMPITALAAGLAALSMGGIPPAIGFAAKELGLKAGFGAAEGAALVVASLVVAGAATVGVALIAAIVPFTGQKRAPREGGHEPSWAMWLGPLALGVVGISVGLVPTLGSGAIVEAAAGVASGASIKTGIQPWYGVDEVLLLSVVSIVLGALILWRRLDVRAAIERADIGFRIGPEKGYVLLELSMLDVAKRITARMQSGQLRLYVLTVVATMVALVWLALLGTGALPSIELDTDLTPWEAIIAALIASAAIVVVTSRSRLGAVAALGVVGYGIALVYVLFGAPDLALAQILVETLTVLLFVLTFYHMPAFGRDTERSSRLRDGAIAIGAGALVTVLVLAAAGTDIDPISHFFDQYSYQLAKGRNIVNTIIVDFRALDTLAEVFVLAAAGFGVFALLKLRLRSRREKGS